MNPTEFCTKPFEEIEIHNTGEVYVCCPNWNQFYSIGNIFENSVEEVWNSKKAIELREKIINKDYSLCDEKSCLYLQQQLFLSEYKTECKPNMPEYPKVIRFAYDKECNIACKICRDRIKRLSEEDLEKLNSKIDTFFLPLLKSAKVLIVNSYGDPFGSRHSSLLIKKAAEKYPDLKFDFHTNGTLCDENHLKSLNITPERIDNVRISIHAASKKTYAKTVPNGEFYFPKIIENLKYLQKIKYSETTTLFQVYIHFVVTADNYKEIPDFIKLAKKVDASPRFWEYRRENCDYMIKENLNICNQEHKRHKDLLKVLRHKLVHENKEFFSPILYNLIENSK